MKNIGSVIKRWGIIVVSGLIIAFLALAAFLYISVSMSDGILVEGTGRNNIDFSVYYFENNLFPENPIPSGLHFLRHLTDYIKVESSFSADFSEDFDLIYSYTAQKTFLISHPGAGGAASVIYQSVTELSNAEGRTFGSRLEFNSESPEGEPGGMYLIFLGDYLEILNEFIEYTGARAGGEEDGAMPVFRTFSAEVVIEFTYTLRALPININESLTRGVRIPISQDVFTIETTGTPGFSESIIRPPDVPALEMPVIAAFITLLTISGFGMFYGIYNLSRDTDENHKRTNCIIKKYGSEIIISRHPLDLTDYRIVEVDDFEDIIKLAINLNKHITCYKDDKSAGFYTMVDMFAYCHLIEYEVPSPAAEDTDNSIANYLDISSLPEDRFTYLKNVDTTSLNITEGQSKIKEYEL